MQKHAGGILKRKNDMKHIIGLFCCLLFFFSCEMKKGLLSQREREEEEGVPENVGLLDLHLVAEREAAVPGTKGDTEEDLYLVTDDFCVSILDRVGRW